jgi:pilus assembly protein CpaE
VIVSSTADPAQLLEAMRMGVNEWVAEPINIEELLAAVRRVARPAGPPQIGRTIAVIGAKGGIGATTVAVNLATSLRRASKEPTLLVDLHLAYGDAAVFLGVEPRFSVVDALENIHRLDEAYLKGLVTKTKVGVDLLGSSSTLLRGSFDTARVRSLLEVISTMYRYIVLDCPRSDAVMLESIDAASQVVVLANQELTTLRTASRLLTGLRQRCGNERVKLAITRLDLTSEIRKADIERVLAGQVKYVFPNDYQAAISAITRGEPLILQNHSRLASSFEQVAIDLGGLPHKGDDKNAAKSGLFRLWR